MKIHYASILTILAIAFCHQAQGQGNFQSNGKSATILISGWPGPTFMELRIAPFKDSKAAAVSVTFDDNLPEQQSVALPIMAQHNIKGSFFVIANQNPWALASAAIAQGHEVGSHGYSHVDLRNATNLKRELKGSQDSILNNTGILPLTIAWPFGGNNLAVRDSAAQYYMGGRNAGINPQGYEKYNYKNYFQVGATLVDSNSGANWLQKVGPAIADTGWVVAMYHGINTGYAAVPAAMFNQQMQGLDSLRDSVWIAPFGDVLSYIKQSNNAKFRLYDSTVSDLNFTYFYIEIADSLNPEWHNDSITVEYEFTGFLPPRSHTFVVDGKYIQPIYMAGPPHYQAGRFNLARDSASGARRFELIFLTGGSVKPSNVIPLQIYPNPVSTNACTIKLPQAARGMVQVMNLQGKVVHSHSITEPSNQLDLQLPSLAPGMYMVHLKDDATHYSGRLVIN